MSRVATVSVTVWKEGGLSRGARWIFIAAAAALMLSLLLYREAASSSTSLPSASETPGAAAFVAGPASDTLEQQQRADDEARAYRRVEEAFNDGDFRALFEIFADMVDVSIMGERAVYSRSQASYVVRDFFRMYPPEEFAFDVSPESPGNQFTLGHYQPRGQEHALRIFVRMRVRDDRWELKELRIEPAQSR